MQTRQGSSNGVKRLTRRADDKIIAGVAGGLADYTGLDPVIFRIGFIVLTFLGGIGIAAYAAGWFLIPKAGGGGAPADSALGRIKDLPVWVGIVLLLIGAGLIINTFAWGDPAILWAIVLVAIGVVLLRDEPKKEAPPPPPVPPSTPAPPPSTAPEATAETTETPAGTGGGSTATLVAAARAPDARGRRRRESSPLGWFILAAVLMAVGFGAVLENWDVLSLDVGQYFALAILIIGTGLLVGALWGRSRLMILLGLFLIPMVLASSFIDMPLRGTVGDSYLVPRTASDLEHYELLAGQMTIDLTQLSWEEGVLNVTGNVAMGELEVIVPRDVQVVANGQMELGELDIFRYYDDGTDLTSKVTAGPDDAERALTLDLEGGIGSIQVYWSSELPPPRIAPDESETKNESERARRDRGGQGG